MSQIESQSLFSKQVQPRTQALLAFSGILVFSLIGSAFDFENEKLTEQFPWVISAAFMLVFALFNSILWIPSQNSSSYLSQSVICYIALAFAAGLLAYAITGIAPQDAGSIKAIFLILTMGYIVFLAIMGTIKQLIVFFNNEQEKKLSGKSTTKKRRRKR